MHLYGIKKVRKIEPGRAIRNVEGQWTFTVMINNKPWVEATSLETEEMATLAMGEEFNRLCGLYPSADVLQR